MKKVTVLYVAVLLPLLPTLQARSQTDSGPTTQPAPRPADPTQLDSEMMRLIVARLGNAPRSDQANERTPDVELVSRIIPLKGKPWAAIRVRDDKNRNVFVMQEGQTRRTTYQFDPKGVARESGTGLLSSTRTLDTERTPQGGTLTRTGPGQEAGTEQRQFETGVEFSRTGRITIELVSVTADGVVVRIVEQNEEIILN